MFCTSLHSTHKTFLECFLPDFIRTAHFIESNFSAPMSTALAVSCGSYFSQFPYNTENKGKVKVKLSLCLTKHHARKTYCGSGGIAPLILDLGTRWRWAVSFTARPLYPRERALVLIGQEAGWAPEPFWTRW